MEKKQQNRRENTYFKPFSAKKMLFLIVIITSILCINLVSADWGSLSDNLLGYWEFENDVTDSHGGHNGVAHNSPTYTTGIQGDALKLVGGSNQYINITHFADLNFGSDPFSISLWTNVSDSETIGAIISHSSGLGGDGWFVFLYGGGGGDAVQYEQAGDGAMWVTSNDLVVEHWEHFVVVKNGSHISMWQNGTLIEMAPNEATDPTTFDLQIGRKGDQDWYFTGLIDEIAIWDRALTDSEISDLWNSGAGIAYEGVGFTVNTIIVNLTSPINNFDSSLFGLNFTGNYTTSKVNLTNATYHIWDSSGAIFNDTETILINGTTNGTIQEINNFTLDTYNWNIFVCGENATQTICNWSASNYTFTIGATVNNETHRVNVWETASERFELNITLISDAVLYLAKLYYNGTIYTGDILNLGSNKYSLSKNIDIPSITGATDNLTFFWRLTFEKADGSFSFQNLTTHSQTVYQIQVGDCIGDLTNITLNFTAWDEEKLTRIKEGFDFKATFYYWLGGGTITKNVSFSNLSIEEKVICINPSNITYYLIDSDIEYKANESGYVTRNYYFENHTISNVTQNISLYLLNSSDSISFILRVVDQNQQEVEDAFIHTQRFYPGTGKYETVQIAKTDENGKSIGFFKTETADYRFLIKRDSVVELITSKQKVVPEDSPYTLTFTIGVSLESPWADFEDLDDLDYSLYHNSTTNITYFTYIDTSDIFQLGRLLVKEVKYNQTDTTICNKTSTASSATLTCDLSSRSGNFVAYGMITRDGTEKTISIVWAVITTIVEIMGLAGLFLSFFIILVAGCAFLWHPIAGIIGINFAVIMVNIIGLVSWSSLYIFGLIAISIILIFIIKD